MNKADYINSYAYNFNSAFVPENYKYDNAGKCVGENKINNITAGHIKMAKAQKEACDAGIRANAPIYDLVISQFNRLVAKIAQSNYKWDIQDGKIDKEDLFSEGRLGVMHAIKIFKPEMIETIIAQADNEISEEKAIMRYIARIVKIYLRWYVTYKRSFTTIPQSTLFYARKVRALAKELKDKNGVEPSIEELRDAYNATCLENGQHPFGKRRITRMLNLQAVIPTSLESEVQGTDGVKVQDTLPDDEKDLNERMTEQDLEETKENFLKSIDETDRKIVSLLEENKTQEEIAKEVKLTHQAVSHRVKKIKRAFTKVTGYEGRLRERRSADEPTPETTAEATAEATAE